MMHHGRMIDDGRKKERARTLPHSGASVCILARGDTDALTEALNAYLAELEGRGCELAFIDTPMSEGATE